MFIDQRKFTTDALRKALCICLLIINDILLNREVAKMITDFTDCPSIN
jgi:hypothetical protein